MMSRYKVGSTVMVGVIALALSASITWSGETPGEPQHDLEANKKLAAVFFEILNAKDFEALEEILAEEYIENGETTTPQAVGEKFKAYVKGIPEMYIVIHEQIAEGDRVVTRGVWGGVHRGNLMGVPASQREINVRFVVIHRIENGKLAEEWDYHDLLGMMQQIGVLPK